MAYNDHDADDKQRAPKYKGSLKGRAAKAGMDKKSYAQANLHTNSVVGKMARIAQTADGLHGTGHSNSREPGDKRSLGQRLYQVG